MMLPHEFLQGIPEPKDVADVIQAQQITREFYQEVQYREDFRRHCQWYYETARQHQEELKKMRKDINILGWFLRDRR